MDFEIQGYAPIFTKTQNLNFKIGHSSKEKIQLIELVFAPSQKEPIFVNADKVRICEVISNLLCNAIKFTTKEGGRSITIKTEQYDSQVSMSIKDTGSGIDPEIMPKLFSKFVTNSRGGTGIGLFISKSIVEANDLRLKLGQIL